MGSVHRCSSPLGEIVMAAEDGALTGLWFEGQKHSPVFPPGGSAEEDRPVFALAERWLEAYFAGEVPDFTPAVVLCGTAFQKAVWNALLTVPYGRTATYGDIARMVTGSASSARAAAAAVGRNPVSLIVPCHRIIGADGSLTGYAGGLRRKERLLALERTGVILPL